MKRLVSVFALTLGFGCAGGTTSAPVSTASALQTASCPADEVISLQTTKAAGCSQVISGRGGVWVGSVLIETESETYCRHQWQPKAAPILDPTQTGPTRAQGPTTYPTAPGPGAVTASPGKAPPGLVVPPGQGGRRPGPPPDLEAIRHLENAEVDCPIIKPSAHPPLDSGIWKPLQEAFHAQAGRVVGLAAPNAATRVAIIDSAVKPYSDGVSEDRYGHGRTIGRVIADLACPNPLQPDCADRIRNHLALPQLSTGATDLTNGGYFGTRGQLVAAIQQALGSWLEERRKTNGTRLILNLSVGWEPTTEQTFPSKLTSQVVRLVLTRASCLGVLAIAAAGNGTRGEKGAILPAAWEVLPAPTPRECAALGFRAPDGTPVDPEPKTGYRPLVYAVSGVDEGDRPLLTTRPGGQPRLVAYGISVTTNDPRSTHTLVLSGTSLAAAVATGVAAATWGYAPTLPGHDIMSIVYDSAVALKPDVTGTKPDLCLGGIGCDALEIRRVSVCAALEKVLGTAIGCKTVAAHEGEKPKPVPPGPFPPPSGTVLGPFPPCAGAGCSVLGAADTPWTLPQPSYPGCRTCALYRNWNFLYADLDPSIPAAGYNLLRLRTNVGNLVDVVKNPLGQTFWAGTPVSPSTWSATVSFGLDFGAAVVFILTAEESIPVY